MNSDFSIKNIHCNNEVTYPKAIQKIFKQDAPDHFYLKMQDSYFNKLNVDNLFSSLKEGIFQKLSS